MSNKRKANGEGSTTRTENGRWKHTLTVGIKPNGKPARRSGTADTKLEAIRLAEKRAEKYKREQMLLKDKVIFKDLAQKAVKNQLKTGEIEESTYIRKLETLKRFESIENIPLQKLNKRIIDDFFDAEVEKNISDSTLSKDIAILRATFDLAVDENVIDIRDNFMPNYKKPKSKQKKQAVRALDIEEDRKLLNTLLNNDVPYGDIMLTILLTGLRPGEALALKKDDLHLEKNQLYVKRTLTQNKEGQTIVGETTKTVAGLRTVILTNHAVGILKPIFESKTTELLFSENGKPIPVSCVRSSFYAVLKEYNILNPKSNGKVTLHSLRHSYATRCHEAGIDTLIISKNIGHASVKTTLDTYTSVFENTSEKEMSKLDEYYKNNYE